MIKPQAGFQTEFLSSSADIVIGGGAAGVGKTFAELLEPLYHKHVEGFKAMFFRRTTVQIRNPGGLWDKSLEMYSKLGGQAREQQMDWTFPSGATVKFSHLEYESNIYDHQGAEYCLIVFDELTHFTKKQFFYLMSRNRSTCGVKPYIRATCNPDPDSFVAELIEWWIDQKTGFPIPERAGVLRYFVKDEDNIVWGNSKKEVLKKVPHLLQFAEGNIDTDSLVKSITFIPGSIYSNKELLRVDPGYLANLLAQDENTKAQLLEGNWKIKNDNTALFESDKINDIWSNFTNYSKTKCITCDAARFGRDLCVIMVWDGWVVVRIVIFYKSEAHEIVEAIEECRSTFKIGKSMVLVDQDGVGDGTVKLGGYKGFHGGAAPLKEPDTEIKENYDNLKTQCFYRMSKRVNSNEIQIVISSETCIVAGNRSTQVKLGGKIHDIKDLIRQDLMAIKRAKIDMDGKKKINSKEAQKIVLKGRSPDFADTIMMREWFELTATGGTYGAKTY